MNGQHAVVVGGGIGGLCAAIGLRTAGWRVTVAERASRFGEIGAGIMLWPNAVRALRELGVHERMRALSTPQVQGGIRTHRGTWLMRMDHSAVERRLGGPVLGVHRADLLASLLEALPPESLRQGTEITGVTAVAGLTSSSGDIDDADLVVGADGIRSRVRSSLWPQHPGPSPTGTVDWRAVIDDPGAPAFGMSWGPGTEFGSVPLADGRLYWYASINADVVTENGEDEEFLLRHFRSWHHPVGHLIASTPAGAILRHEGAFLQEPLSCYARGRVALLGDAAHAMPPNLGQGACQAIEDAVVLAASAAERGSVPEILHRYDRLRRPRSQAISRSSRRMGRFGQQLSSPPAVAMRDAALRLVPSALSMRGMSTLASWEAPTIRPGR
ncbi:FAD-dependent monooxygenase [Haloactinomyces albus]|uniref:2-polyprenyl-6-methoxyphenol hydroxylase-like FAD-dependent oxidoreductase n=1 Tax=Haloactinomyces albus TaxID=1352928 RepID=A0AAE4CMZ0_9ACTN|nr:FAD-dependent monooxygenase [Haloactinomyces albus]MDR7303369.1 2-polyprenyl-6-methoxyphenol hydroxylase-like FAD-dependent oxidoreductase [Haloactinomyces albus]